ncbi:MAG: lipoyl synthase [Candidatus Hydrogenedens sp.]|jgi:lipoic acid synthetase|nr:lipoyl synthase [Candidatus Hydrogenedens sp.]
MQQKTSRNKFPPWIRTPWPQQGAVDEVRDTLSSLSLNTVCRSAHCPNQGECWSRRTATFMILGNVCSRNCAFCSVDGGCPQPADPEEPKRLAEAVRRLGLRYAVITSVTRDDLPDGGAAHFAAVIRAIREQCPGVAIELLTPDFQGDENAIRTVTDERPEVFGHNVETVPRLHGLLRDPLASYERSLFVLKRLRENLPPECFVKSGLMVGCGEKAEEVLATLEELRQAGCDAVTIGQYLKPGKEHLDVQEFISPEQFEDYEKAARALGFSFVMSAPLVRSSYRAESILSSPEKPGFG